MSRKITPIEHGKFYHIYNRGINSQNIFFEKSNYLYFLQQYGNYIEKIAETFAWCLMPNHFHFLIKIKDEEEIGFIPRKKPLLGSKTTKRVIKNTTNIQKEEAENLDNKKYKPSNQFSHLFNSYAQSINKKYNRHGSLFEAPFRRILIDDEKYYKNLVIYIHKNPVNHGFVNKIKNYKYSSYNSFLSNKPTKLKRNIVLSWFDDIENFKHLHQNNKSFENIHKYINF